MGKETIFEPDYVVDLRIQLGKVIKLNEELTAENARLLEELDKNPFNAISNNIPVLLNEIKALKMEEQLKRLKIELTFGLIIIVLLGLAAIICTYLMRNGGTS